MGSTAPLKLHFSHPNNPDCRASCLSQYKAHLLNLSNCMLCKFVEMLAGAPGEALRCQQFHKALLCKTQFRCLLAKSTPPPRQLCWGRVLTERTPPRSRIPLLLPNKTNVAITDCSGCHST